MKPREEQQALADLRQLQRDLKGLEPLLLDVFARDDQPNTPAAPGAPTPSDPVHVSAVAICRALRKSANQLMLARNATRWVVEAQPRPGTRVQAVPDCMCCGELALPNPVAGLCDSCHQEWTKWRRKQKHPDRARFIADWKKQNADQGKQHGA